MVDLQAAYAACERDCRTHYENFPVASLLLPRRMRPHVAALYAFARAADDFADEGDRTVEERHRLLDLWRARLLDAVAGTTSTVQRPPGPGEPAHTQEIFLALGVTRSPAAASVRAPGRSVERVSAGRDGHAVRDAGRRCSTTAGAPPTRSAAWSFASAVRCPRSRSRGRTRSARHCSSPTSGRTSKATTRRGRIYLPLEEMPAHRRRGGGPGRGTHHAGMADRRSRRPLPGHARCSTKAAPLCDRLRGRLRYEIRLTWLGGTRILDRIEAAHFDVLNHRPTIGAADMPWLAATRLLGWPKGRCSPSERAART